MNISKIEGIGPVNANRLREQGITTTEALLSAADCRPKTRWLAGLTTPVS